MLEREIDRAVPPAPALRRRSLGSLFSWVVLSSLGRQLAFLVVNLVLFERLSRSIYGAVALGFGYLSVFAGLGEFGIRQIGWRDVARQPQRIAELTTSFLSAKTATSLVAIGLYLVLEPWLWERGLPVAIFLLFGLAIAINGGTFEFPLYGLSRMDLVARYSLGAHAIYLVGCLALVTGDGRAWLVPALFVGAMGVLLALEIGWFRARHGPVTLRWDAAEIGGILRTAWPLGVGETLNRLALTYPVILLGMVVDTAGVGNYRLPELVYSFLAQFGHLFAAAGFSQLAHLFQHRRSEVAGTFARMLASMAGTALVAGLALALAGPAVFALAFGDRLAGESITVTRILGLALVFAAPVRFLKGLLASIDRQDMVLAVNTVAVAIGFGAGWTAAAAWGIVGMAVAVAATECITVILLLAGYRWSLGGPGKPARAVVEGEPRCDAR